MEVISRLSMTAGRDVKGRCDPWSLRENDARGKEQGDADLDQVLRGRLAAGVCDLLDLGKL